MLVRMLNYSVNFFSHLLYFFALTLSKSLMLPEAMKLLYVKKMLILIQKRFLSFTFNPSNPRRGGICIYYEPSLALKILDIEYLQECILFDIDWK